MKKSNVRLSAAHRMGNECDVVKMLVITKERTKTQLITRQIHVGQWIREKRLEAARTQQEVAYILGVNVRTVKRWECGQDIPTPQHLGKLANLFDSTLRDASLSEMLT